MEMGLVVIIAIVAFLVGVLGGFLVSKATAGRDSSGNLKNQMDSLQGRFSDYQTEVANHFNKTASIAQKFSQSYQEMQSHLQHSVETLVSDSELRSRLLSEIKMDELKALDYSAEGQVEQDIPEQETTAVNTYNDTPRDYAPKVPGEVGTLAEEFSAKRK
ncbi:hypothetical protein DKL61_15435 [Gammaproteobacteria bacterium ESL0073]|uniref:Z-ring associated protein G n=1 Tax=Entomomonas moraniae TaxID=2213226 RepID=A0A451EP43_9GAMM|nr:DUF1043 family protein [Entomomonas moraniae]AWM81618.1 hypothetical protein DKL61_15435 [Gammaproteobacteria bacterium ESL0073]AZS51558.1 DUF1043 family protein [Entomomonas moraniae]